LLTKRPGVTSAAALLAATALVAGCSGAPAPDERLNVVLITLDTLRADHLGCYGYAKDTSPTLDRMAEESFVFEQAVAQSAVTPVSHASIFTGLNPYRHGLRSLHGGIGYSLEDEQTTLAEVLVDQGYATAGFVSAFPATAHYGLHQGFQTWDEDMSSGRDGRRLVTEHGIVDTGRAQRRADDTTDAVLPWIERRDEQPFFLWVHYFDVHDPALMPPSPYVLRFPPESRDQPDVLRAIYDAEIAFVDAQIARLLAALDAAELMDRTLIAVVADHGEGLGDHGWWGHTLLFQEQLRVPLLIRVPGMQGRRIGGLARTIDLAPTLLELLDLTGTLGDTDGRSLAGALRGGPAPEGIAYSESVNDLAAYHGTVFENASMYAVNDGRFKLLVHRERNRDVELALYDLQSDPAELRNLWGSSPGPGRALRAHLDGDPSILEAPARAEIEPAVRKRLEALGYLR
jgi:arylsulfatase A-like enzyme